MIPDIFRFSMKFNLVFIPLFFVAPLALANVKPSKIGSPVWIQGLKEVGAESFSVCGNSAIQVTNSSFKKNFLVGEPIRGYVITDLVSYNEYWASMKSMNLTAAKADLSAKFSKARIWQVGEDRTIQSQGLPTEVELPFVATVKDCVEGAKTSLGNDCSRHPVEQRMGCCMEKFLGPRISWKTQAGDFKLFYSPDPTVRLRVPGEKNHRYCNVVDLVNLLK